MALIIAGATVATGMSTVADTVLRSDNILIPNLTYSDRFQVNGAGQIQVSRYHGSGITGPKTPGSNFDGSKYANDVTLINCNNSFQKESVVAGAVASSMPLDVLTDATINVSEDVREEREATALAVLAGGTVHDVKTAITKSNVKEIILGARAALRKKNANANVVLCSVDMYTSVLEAAGSEFSPMFNDSVALTGKIGSWLGMVFLEVSRLDNASTYQYIDGEGVLQSQSVEQVDFIMYDANAFSVIDKLVTLRAVDSENSVAVRVQGEINSGLKITNADCVLVKKVPLVVTVTLDAGDGEVTPASIVVTDGVPSASLNDATYAGHTFDGWFTSEVGGTEVTSVVALTENTTLYAHYTAI